MAYISQEIKKELAPAIKAVCKKYGVKATIGIKHHSTLVVNVNSGDIDFIENYNTVADTRTVWGRPADKITCGYLDVHHGWYNDVFSGIAKEFFSELFTAMKGDKWFDKSDIQSDYFHTAYYMDVNVGQWDKPYTLTK